jgi:broad specificity phosphatase PhoE
MPTTIHLMRHGAVENPDGVIYGRLPGYGLSERGREQAAAVAQRLASEDVGLMRSSPLQRAQETAAIVAAVLGMDVTTDDRLIESGTTLEGVGRTARSFLTSPRNWWQVRNPWRPSWGESFAEIRVRMIGAIDDAVAEAGGKDVVIVSHQTPVLVARLALENRTIPPWLAFVPCGLGSLTSMVIDAGRVVSTTYYAPPSAA